MLSSLLLILFAFVLITGIWLVLSISQKKKKLLPEFINGKPTIVFFWVDNQPCRDMNSMMDKIKNDFKGSVKVLNFNAIRDYRIAENYLIFDVPVVILFDKEGNPVLKITKPEEYPKLEAKLKEII